MAKVTEAKWYIGTLKCSVALKYRYVFVFEASQNVYIYNNLSQFVCLDCTQLIIITKNLILHGTGNIALHSKDKSTKCGACVVRGTDVLGDRHCLT